MGSPLAALAPVLGLPVQALGVDPDLPLGHGLVVGLEKLPGQHDDVLALVVVDQVQVLQRGDHVLLLDGRQL
ncbi:hypothetical protein DPMN_099489 [Dreissena polymorpha]|uniref:Secreted protein n=1 Tax=Dreissena polymorpha TaxID=45954 RepID=A0A9D4LFK1_DREPO|nr:hypothetical protein DPMN_099489 [Dreissena polymorpha]